MGRNRKKRGGKQVKDGGQSGAKESSSGHAGPAQVISTEVEKEVTASEEVGVAEETEVNWDKKCCVNVLFIGHAGAGKSKALQKILELGGKRKSTIQKLKVTEDSSKNRSMEDTMAIHDDVKGTTAEFGEVIFETETTSYHILEALSHYHYVYKMTSRALQADIAVLWISGSKDDLLLNEKIQQTCNCVEAITTLDIPKILLVDNKMDDPSWTRERFDEIVSKATKGMPKAEKVARSLSLSCEADYRSLFDSLDDVQVPLQTSECLPFRSREQEPFSIEYLIANAKYLDDEPFRGDLWYCRAKALLGLDNYSEAFEAADKARECDFRNHKLYVNLNDALKYKMEGDHFRAMKQFKKAIERYEHMFNFFQDKKFEKALQDVIKETKRQMISFDALARVDKSLVITPKDASLWYQKAKFLAELNLVQESFEAVEKALDCDNCWESPRLKDDHFIIYKMKGDHCYFQKDFSGAVDNYISACLRSECENAVEMIQEVINKCLDLDKKLRQEMNEHKKDMAEIDQTLLKDPTNAAIWYKKAKILAGLQKFAEAFEAAQKASDYNYFGDPLFEKECHPLFYKMEGDNYFGMEKFDDAHSLYIKTRNIYESEHCEEAVRLSQELVLKATTALFSYENRLVTKGLEKKENSDVKEEREVEEREVEEKKVEEVESVMREAVEIHQDQDPSPSSNLSEEIKISISSEYLIGDKHLDYVHSGFKIIDGGKLPISFIDCSELQKENLNNLISFGRNNVNILSILDMVTLTINEARSKFLIVEPIQKVESHFILLRQKWGGVNDIFNLDDDQKRKVVDNWWNFIRFNFRKIFRDILDGLIFLYSKDVACGNVLDGLLVDTEGHGKILPSMDPRATFANDIYKVVTLMKGIIYSPFRGHKGEMSLLPDEVSRLVTHLLEVKDILKFCPIPPLIVSSMIDHPIFWTSEERAEFFIKLRRVLRRDFVHKEFGGCFYQCLEDRMFSANNFFWTEQLPGGIIKEIWRKGDPESVNDEVLSNIGWVKIEPYRDGSDIIRFINAVYTHYNDCEYGKFGIQGLNLSTIEEKLTEIFPQILEVTKMALSDLVFSASIRPKPNYPLKGLKEISRHSNMF